MAKTLKEVVDDLFARLSEGHLGIAGPTLESGWEMTLPSGESVSRSALQSQAQTAIDLQAAAIPYLVPFVRSENLALRYVAIYALERITGVKWGFSYFQRDLSDAETDGIIRAWQSFYDRQQAAR